MALEGQIKVFGVADIIQLISQQQKSGILCIKNKLGVKAGISFLNGNISDAKPSERKTSCPLGEMLISAKLLFPKDLKIVLKEQRKTFEYLGQILVRKGFVSSEIIEKALITQIYETVYDVLQWNDGTYSFEQKNVVPDVNLSHPIPTESILLDVLRMVDVWPELEKEVPSFDVFYRHVIDSSEEGLDDDETIIYRLVDGESTIQEIINRGLLGKFVTVKALIDMARRGYIERIIPDSKGISEKSSFKIMNLIKPFSYAAVVMMLAAVFILPTIFPNNIFPFIDSEAFNQAIGNSYSKSRNIFKIEKALEMYRMKEGPYPQRLSDLVAAGFLREKDIELSGNEYIQYVRLDKRYKLRINQASE
jgi:predicted DNA-binding transcriptional regulator